MNEALLTVLARRCSEKAHHFCMPFPRRHNREKSKLFRIAYKEVVKTNIVPLANHE